MARSARTSRKLIAAVLPLFVSIVALAGARTAYGYGDSDRHFLSWESHNRPREVQRLKRYMRSRRRFDLDRRRVVKLKPTTIWNKRPYQFSTPHVAEGRIFVGVDSGWFYAIGTKPPHKAWHFNAVGPIQAEAEVAAGTVYVGDCKGYVYALDAEGGTLRWKLQLDAEIMAKPLAVGDRLYVQTLSGRLFALDRQRGIEIWHTDASERSFGFSVRRSADPVLYDGLLYVGTSAGTLFAFREADGSIVWARQLGDRQSLVYDVDSTPLFVDGHLYVASADGRLFRIEPKSGRVLWATEAGGATDLLFHDGVLYASGGGRLYAVDPESGFLKWEQDLETPGISSPAAGKNYIAVVTTEDKLYLVDIDNGDIAFDRYVRKGTFGDPVIVGDQLIVLANTGRLFSFRVRELKPRKMIVKPR